MCRRSSKIGGMRKKKLRTYYTEDKGGRNTTAVHFDKGNKIVINNKTGDHSGVPWISEHMHMTWTLPVTGVTHTLCMKDRAAQRKKGE